MHSTYMIFPVTALAIAGYVALSCALNAQGKMRLFGQVLAGWAFLLAVVVAGCAIYGAVTGQSAMMKMRMYHHHGMHSDEMPPGPPAPGADAPGEMPPPPAEAPPAQ